MATNSRSRKALLAENEELHRRLEEAEETLAASGSSEVDAFAVPGPEVEQVFTLKRAAHSYRVLVETMKEGAATLAVDGTILCCNDRLATLLQVPQERLIGTPLASYVAPADSPLLFAWLEQCTTEQVKDELTLINGAGNSVPTMISCCAVDLAGIRGLSMVVTDLSEQRRNEEIVTSEKLARSIIEQAGEAIIVCDERGRIIRASLLAHQLCGENPLLKPFDETYQLRVAVTGAPIIVSQALAGETFRNLEVIQKRRGEWRNHLVLNATPLMGAEEKTLGCVVTLTDITAQKQMEAALRESEQRWATTLTSIGDAVIATDTAGRVTFLNAVAETLTGWSLQEAVSKPVKQVFNIVNEHTREEVADPVSKVIAAGMVVGLANHTILLRKDGAEVAIDDCGAPIMDKDGGITGVVLIFRDITERRRVEEALCKVHDELEIRVQTRTQELLVANQAVKLERQRLYDVLETLPIMISLLTTDYHVPFANRSFREKFGEPQGRRCFDLCFGRTEPCDFCETFSVFNTGLPHQWEFASPGGGSIIVAYDFPFSDTDGSSLILEMGIDITERRRTEERIRHQTRILEGINRIFHKALTCDTENQLGQTCLAVVEEVTQSSFGMINEMGEDGLLHNIAISNPGWEQCMMHDKSGHCRQLVDLKVHGLYGRVIIDGKGFFTNDPASHPDSIGTPDGHPAIKSFLGVPLIRDGKITGMVGLGNREGGYRKSVKKILPNCPRYGFVGKILVSCSNDPDITFH
jgi:PAS domain S-box-containing protein